MDVSWLSAVLWSLLLRLLTSTFPYSGQNSPPMFGDFEAQRHWMEITTNLEPDKWYVNSTQNDLLYWGLDYPPLTAYHSWLCGKMSELLNPEWTALNSSRGHESKPHKLFMRHSVLISDLAIFFPAVLYFASLFKSENEKSTAVWALLINPALILIDYGHFQYNSVCLGFFLWFVAFTKAGHLIPASIAFCLALNFKHMALYFAVPVFLHLVRYCYGPLNIRRFLSLAAAVVVVFAVLWSPFILAGKDVTLQVVRRLFPFSRGLFEDKVANFWCVSSVFIKYRKLFSQDSMALISLCTTVLFSLPSWAMLLVQGNDHHRRMMNFKFALFNTSMAFFLFSYQVHEKSILFPLMALYLVSPWYPEFLLFFTNIACFSMAPLLSKDGLLLAYVALVVQNILIINKTHFEDLPERRWNKFYLLRLLFISSLGGCTLLHLSEQLLAPPARYPHLFVLLNCVYSFAHFLIFFLYSNNLQFRHMGDGPRTKVKTK